MFIESCERLFAIAAEGGKGEIVELGLGGIIVMLVTIVVKAGVWITTRGSKSSTVQGSFRLHPVIVLTERRSDVAFLPA